MLRVHSSLTGCKKGAGRREGHCRHHRQCACAAKGAEKFSVPRNLLLLFGRLLLERRGASGDLQGEVDFCRSARGFFTSCSSTRITTSSSPASRCGRRNIVDNCSPSAAYVVRRAPRTEFARIFRVQHSCTRLTRKPFTHAPHLHRHASSSGPHMSSALTLLPLRREGCGVHLAPSSSPRRPTTPWPQVTILDFLETFSSSSRRWRHQFLLSVSLLLPDFRRAVCVMARTGVASRAAVRGVHFFASIVMSV